MESGATQRRYDTFVMTGDMIIKTTSTKAVPASQARSPDVATRQFDDSLDEQVWEANTPSSRPVLKKGALNGSDKLEIKACDADHMCTSLVNQDVRHYYKETRIELDIPPDDISTDDEQYEIDAVDIDFDTLPPPPYELLSSSSGNKTSGSTVLETCIDSPVVKFEVVNSSNTCNEHLPSIVGDVEGGTSLPPLDWRNSLDEAIARLENELPYKNQLPSKSGDYGSEPLAIGTVSRTEDSNGLSLSESTDTIQSAKIWSAHKSNQAGIVRSTKSQENCNQFGSDSSNMTQFVNIDVVEGNSTSVEVLHCDPSAAVSLDSSSRQQQNVLPKKSKAKVSLPNKTLNSKSSDSPWWDVLDTEPKTKDDVGQLQETCIPNTDSHMHECYLVCPTAANTSSDIDIVVYDRIVDESHYKTSSINTSAKKDSPQKIKTVQRETDIDAPSNDLSSSASPVDSNSSGAGLSGINDICRPQQLKEVDRPSACRLAKRLYHLDGFRKSDVAKHLSKQNEFSFLVGEEYVRYFDFTGLTLDSALRAFLGRLVVSGETQERERILAHFSRRYIECNPRVYNSEDACHTLTCAIMLLNTDLHKQNMGKRMTLPEFIDNLADLNDGENFARSLLSEIYQSIRDEPIEFELENDETEEVAQSGVQPQQFTFGTGSNPFLSVPDSSKTVEYKKGFVMRKCCTDPDGRKTPLGRRGWKMWYAVLCDMILYLHKDERSYKNSSSVNFMNNVVHVHHALATRASEYTKKQHVFCLKTADWSQYLFQTSNSEDCQVWIDAVNYAAASLSAPPLPGACGSQKKFQRPLMPSSYSRLSLKDQLNQHEAYLTQIESDLADHIKYPPERGAKSRIIQDYIEKENFLQFEQRRFKTYCQCLNSRLHMPWSTGDLKTPVGCSEHTSVLNSPIGEMEETPSRVTGQENATKTSVAVQRSTSDRLRKQGKRGTASASMQQSGDTRQRRAPRPSSSLQSARSMPAMLFETRV